MDILDILLDILLKPPQPLMGLFLQIILNTNSLTHLGLSVTHLNESLSKVESRTMKICAKFWVFISFKNNKIQINLVFFDLLMENFVYHRRA